jgi:MOSC domain-containing protein YiiM
VPTLLSVNLAVPRSNSATSSGTTGIDKRPSDGPVQVRPPGPKTTGLGSGVARDQIFDTRVHGGDEQAVYAYAREDLDLWQHVLGKELSGGVFGENLTTAGLDVTGALIGERWRISGSVVVEVNSPRIPCATFAEWMGEPNWIKRFTVAARPGAYLRVVQSGLISAGDEITVLSRPAHRASIGLVFRALTLEPELLAQLLDVAQLPDAVRAKAARRIATARRP